MRARTTENNNKPNKKTILKTIRQDKKINCIFKIIHQKKLFISWWMLILLTVSWLSSLSLGLWSTIQKEQSTGRAGKPPDMEVSTAIIS